MTFDVALLVKTPLIVVLKAFPILIIWLVVALESPFTPCPKAFSNAFCCEILLIPPKILLNKMLAAEVVLADFTAAVVLLFVNAPFIKEPVFPKNPVGKNDNAASVAIAAIAIAILCSYNHLLTPSVKIGINQLSSL